MTPTTIPTSRYCSPSFMERERQGLWPRVWLAVAHELEAPRVRIVAGRRLELERGPDGCRVVSPGVTSARWGGFLWVRLAPEGPTLEAYLGPVREALEAYGLDAWVLESAVHTELGCNWKASVDAHNEGYHVPSLHPEVAGIVDDAAERIHLLGRHSRIVVPMARPSGRIERPELSEPVRRELVAAGIDPAPFERDPRRARARLQALRRRPDHAALSDDQLTDNHQFFVFPNLQLNTFADHALVFRHWPDPEVVDRCGFEQLVLRRRRPGETAAPLVCRPVSPADRIFGPVTGADLAMLPRLQKGLSSAGSSAMRLGSRERCIAHFHRGIDETLAS